MLSEIERLILGGNDVHDLIELKKDGAKWIVKVSPSYNWSLIKTFVFDQVVESYEDVLTDDGTEIKYPLSIVGFDSFQYNDELWRFCLNATEMEWGFISKWPTQL